MSAVMMAQAEYHQLELRLRSTVQELSALASDASKALVALPSAAIEEREWLRQGILNDRNKLTQIALAATKMAGMACLAMGQQALV